MKKWELANEAETRNSETGADRFCYNLAILLDATIDTGNRAGLNPLWILDTKNIFIERGSNTEKNKQFMNNRKKINVTRDAKKYMI